MEIYSYGSLSMTLAFLIVMNRSMFPHQPSVKILCTCILSKIKGNICRIECRSAKDEGWNLAH